MFPNNGKLAELGYQKTMTIEKLEEKMFCTGLVPFLYATQ